MQPYEQLEVNYAKHVNTQHACVVNTGTAALHLSIEVLKITEKLPYDTQVIVPDFTMYASGLAVRYANLTPVFIDCDDNLLIDLDKVEEHFKSNVNIQKTRILMVTHVYGRVVDMDRVMDIAARYNLRVIEDACEAQGAYWNNKPIGSFDIGCFSFYRNKIIHAEEGGIITSNDLQLIELARDMRSMSFGTKHNYYHEQIGFNYRCTNSQADMALKSLSNIKDNLTTRQEIASVYNKIIPEQYQMPNNRKVIWVYDIRHPNAENIVFKLKEKNIAARHSFKPLSSQPLFNHWNVGKKATDMSKNVFYLNVNPKQTDYDIHDIGRVVNELLSM